MNSVSNKDKLYLTKVSHKELQISLLLFYVLAKSKVISGRVPTSDCAHSWRHYSVASLGNQAASTMTWYPTVSDYPGTEQTNPCPILILPSTSLGSDKNQFWSHCFGSTKVWTHKVRILRSPKTGDGRSTNLAILSGMPWKRQFAFNGCLIKKPICI